MTSLQRNLILAVAGLLVLVVLAAVLLNSLISGQAIRDELIRMAAERGIQLEVAGVDVPLGTLLLLQPEVRITGLRIANPPGYSEEPLLSAKEMRIEMPFGPLWGGRVENAQIEIDSPQIRIERDDNDSSNLAQFLNQLSRNREPGTNPGGSPQSTPVVRYLHLDSGRLLYVSETGTEELDLTDLAISLRDLGAASRPHLELSANLLGSSESRVGLEGSVGPFDGNGVPVEGSVEVTIIPSQLPVDLRRRYAGNLLEAPGDSASIAIKTKFSGDLTRQVGGPGKVSIEDLGLGRDAQHRLILEGELPLSVSVDSALARPRIRFDSEAGKLTLGSGLWAGSFQAEFVGKELRGTSAGSLQDFSIQEVLSTFSESGEQVSGTATLPRYELRFRGRNPAALRRSLSGSGALEVKNGHFAFFDLLGTIEKQARQVLSGEQTESGNTDFASLSTRFSIADETVALEEMVLERGETRIQGQGTFGFDTQLNLRLMVPLPSQLFSLFGSVSDETVRLPVLITGTLQAPLVQPEFRQLGIGAASDLFEALFGRKKKP